MAKTGKRVLRSLQFGSVYRRWRILSTVIQLSIDINNFIIHCDEIILLLTFYVYRENEFKSKFRSRIVNSARNNDIKCRKTKNERNYAIDLVHHFGEHCSTGSENVWEFLADDSLHVSSCFRPNKLNTSTRSVMIIVYFLIIIWF